MEIFMKGIKKMIEFERAHIAKLKADAQAAAAAAAAAATAALSPPPSVPETPKEAQEEDEAPKEEDKNLAEELPMEKIAEIPEKE